MVFSVEIILVELKLFFCQNCVLYSYCDVFTLTWDTPSDYVPVRPPRGGAGLRPAGAHRNDHRGILLGTQLTGILQAELGRCV